MSRQTHIVIRAALCFAIVCSVWLAPQHTVLSRSNGNIEAITLIAGPLDAPAGVKMGNASQNPYPSLHVVLVSSASSSTKPVCYTKPICEPTRLVQFRTSLTRTPLLTSCS